MDNLCHSMAGLAAARAGLDRWTPWATPALVVSANLPDADLLFFEGRAAYLLYHRGISHSLPGITLFAPLVAGLVCLAGRALVADPSRRPRWWPMLALIWLGMASNSALDALNTYGLRPWLPLSEARYFGDLAFIVDPWMWLLFGGAACLGGPRGRRHGAMWLAGALVVTMALAALIARADGPMWALLPWLSGVAIVATVRRATADTARATLARAACALALAYIAALGALSTVAQARGADWLARRHGPAQRTSTHPEPAIPWRLTLMAQHADVVHRVRVDLLRGEMTPLRPIARRMDDPALARLEREHPFSFRAWRAFARHPMTERRDGRLLLDDARYRRGGEPGWCALQLPLND